jgi:hypothetical protein
MYGPGIPPRALNFREVSSTKQSLIFGNGHCVGFLDFREVDCQDLQVHQGVSRIRATRGAVICQDNVDLLGLYGLNVHVRYNKVYGGWKTRDAGTKGVGGPANSGRGLVTGNQIILPAVTPHSETQSAAVFYLMEGGLLFSIMFFFQVFVLYVPSWRFLCKR